MSLSQQNRLILFLNLHVHVLLQCNTNIFTRLQKAKPTYFSVLLPVTWYSTSMYSNSRIFALFEIFPNLIVSIKCIKFSNLSDKQNPIEICTQRKYQEHTSCHWHTYPQKKWFRVQYISQETYFILPQHFTRHYTTSFFLFEQFCILIVLFCCEV